MRSLTWRLSAALLLVVFVSVGVMALLTNWGTSREFQQYVSTGNHVMEQRAAASLAQYYEQTRSWDKVQAVLNRFIMMRKGRFILADASGRVVADSDNELLGRAVSGLGLPEGTPVISARQRVGTIFMVAPAPAQVSRVQGSSSSQLTTGLSSGRRSWPCQMPSWPWPELSTTTPSLSSSK